MRHTRFVNVAFPDPTVSVPSRAELFLGYLDYFRSRVVSKVAGLPDNKLRQSRLPSGWTPLELLKHLTFVELRWIEWGLEGHEIAAPWGDHRDAQVDNVLIGPEGHPQSGAVWAQPELLASDGEVSADGYDAVELQWSTPIDHRGRWGLGVLTHGLLAGCCRAGAGACAGAGSEPEPGDGSRWQHNS